MAAEGTRAWATIGGVAALAIWSSSMALVRGVSESLSTLTGTALASGAGGLVGLAVAWARGCPPWAMLRLPRRYLLGCGGLFAAYMVCYYAAIGWAPNRSTAMAVNLLNYLWPALTVVLSVPLLHRRARWTLALGCVIAVAGTAVVVLGSGPFRWDRVCQAGPGVLAPLALALAAGVLWALYSNLVKRWGRSGHGAIPLFLLASAGALALLRLGGVEEATWSGRAVLELCILAVFPAAIAYTLWESGMRRGNHLLLSLISYSLPITSTAFAAVYLRVPLGRNLIIGCLLVTVGALICRYSLTEEGEPASDEKD